MSNVLDRYPKVDVTDYENVGDMLTELSVQMGKIAAEQAVEGEDE